MLNNLGIEIKDEKAEEIIRTASHSGTFSAKYKKCRYHVISWFFLGNELIDENDFLSFVKQIQQLAPSLGEEDVSMDLMAAFKVFDLDGDGFITREELKVAMEMIGEDITEEQLTQVIIMADTDHDGKINYEGRYIFG